jgi:hypothetical protein
VEAGGLLALMANLKFDARYSARQLLEQLEVFGGM